jgi:hypothetical protein
MTERIDSWRACLDKIGIVDKYTPPDKLFAGLERLYVIAPIPAAQVPIPGVYREVQLPV